MLDAGLLLTLSGLALLDAVVTSIIYVVIAILLAARRPVPTGVAYAVGSLGSFFLLTLMLYFGASFMADVMDTFTLWIRRLVLIGAAGFLIYLGIRRFKTRPRHGMKLPTWINPATAFPIGIATMLMDLPFSFPMFLAVERLVDINLDPGAATLILAAYTTVSSLPTILLILGGIVFGARARELLERLLHRATTGYSRASWRMALLFFALAAACLAVLFFVVG